MSQVVDLVNEVGSIYRGSPWEPHVTDIANRLHEPLRVAIAGKVKAGKSTLLNALVGDELAPTDAGECTRVVTWYRHGIVYKVSMATRDGAGLRQVPFTRDSGAIDVQLGDVTADQIESLVVEWPAPALTSMTLIDTPGIGSLSTDISARSHDFLTPDDEQTTPSDAVVYLLRHLHANDVQFLHSFHEEEYAQPSPVNCVAVLSRADEVAGGRIDAMVSASKIAQRYAADTRLRRLVQTVVPVAGLLAQAGANLREIEFRRLRHLASLDPSQTEMLLLSADRFATSPDDVGLAPNERRQLLDRLGIYGVKLSLEMIRRDYATTASTLADALVNESGIDELRHVLLTLFSSRRDTLKARSALLAVERLAHAAPNNRTPEIVSRIEQIMSGAHEFAELRLLNALRGGEIELRQEDQVEIETLLGSRGTSLGARLGLDEGGSAEEIRAAYFEALSRWRLRAENPVSSLAVSTASRVMVRSYEGLYQQIADLAPAT